MVQISYLGYVTFPLKWSFPPKTEAVPSTVQQRVLVVANNGCRYFSEVTQIMR